MASSSWQLLGILGLGGTELIVILVLMLVLFGTRLPKAARSLGSSIKEFKKGMKEAAEPDPTEDPEHARPTQIEDRSTRNAQVGSRDREGQA